MQELLTTFTQAVGPVASAMAQIAAIAVLAGVLVRRGVITQTHIHSLSVLTVDIFLPCLTFSQIVKGFDPSALAIWWILPLAAWVMVGVGLALGAAVFRPWASDTRNMLAMSAIQNAGYLPLPLGAILFPDQFGQYAAYCFLYILGISPLLWSLGKVLCTSGNGEKLKLQSLITPPLVASLAAVALVFMGLRQRLPELVMGPITMLGQAAVPAANVVLGAVLGSITIRFAPYWRSAIGVAAVKLLALPILTIGVLKATGLNEHHPLMATLLVIQSASAPATGLILQVRKYGGDELKVGNVMLMSYVLCAVLLPLWVAMWYAVR